MGQILALVSGGAASAAATAGETVQIVLNQTPFYGESGGQVGDTGHLRTATGAARITDTQKAQGVFVHHAEVTEGRIEPGQGATLEVDHARRGAIRANHSATHLLHEALRRALGDHVAQRGSLNAADRLRFDFSHSAALSAADLASVEAEVNAFIRQNTPVTTRIMTPDEARGLGAQALFGEKYGDEVRVVAMGALPGSGKGADGATYSLELCGGTHVARTGDIGAFVALADQASSAGVRRIEALTGQAAIDHLRGQDRRLAEVASALRTAVADVPERVRALIEERRSLQAEVAQLRRDLAMGGGGAAADAPEDVAGLALSLRRLAGVGGRDLPALIDQMRAAGGADVIVLAAESEGKAAVAVGVGGAAMGRVSAIDVLRAVVGALGGKGGGGRADLAQGGAPSLENWEGAMQAARSVIQTAVGRA